MEPFRQKKLILWNHEAPLFLRVHFPFSIHFPPVKIKIRFKKQDYINGDTGI